MIDVGRALRAHRAAEPAVELIGAIEPASARRSYSPWRVGREAHGVGVRLGSGKRRVTWPAVFIREITLVLRSAK